MNQTTPNQDLVSRAMDDYFKNRNIPSALSNIELYITNNPRFIPFPYQFKADILRDSGKIDDALSVINTGLSIFPRSHDLLKRRAEIIGFYKGDLESALQDIGSALIFFESTSNDQLIFSNNNKNFDKTQFLKNYTTSKVDLQSIQEQLNRLNSVNIIKSEINDIKKKLELRFNETEGRIEKERLRSIELVGIFTAILGFIFANVQKSSQISNNLDLAFFNLTLLAPIAFFVYLISKINSK